VYFATFEGEVEALCLWQKSLMTVLCAGIINGLAKNKYIEEKNRQRNFIK